MSRADFISNLRRQCCERTYLMLKRMFGSSSCENLEPYHNLMITDIRPIGTKHEFLIADVSSTDQAMRAADGMDASIKCSVFRDHRKTAGDVKDLMFYNTMTAAIEQNIVRAIGTGLCLASAGPTYRNYDFMINEGTSPHAGMDLYLLTKSVGPEICPETCNVFTQNCDIYMTHFLFSNFRDPDDPGLKPATDLAPCKVS